MAAQPLSRAFALWGARAGNYAKYPRVRTLNALTAHVGTTTHDSRGSMAIRFRLSKRPEMHRIESTGYARDAATAMDNLSRSKGSRGDDTSPSVLYADKRGFAPAHELQDGLWAEWDIDRGQMIRHQVARTGTTIA